MIRLILATLLFNAAAAAAVFGTVVPAAQWFVDSVNGSDSNNGTTAATPFKTIAKLAQQSVQMNDLVALKCGSTWKETIGITTTGLTLASWGSCSSESDLPLFDGSESIASGSWSKTDGQTNVYQVSVATESPGSGGFVNIFENANFMTRATSIANCDATPGSMYPSCDDCSPVTLYIHPTGSGNPGSNGKTYEYTARTAVIVVGNSAKVLNIRGRRVSGASGILVGGNDVQVVGGVYREGSRHNILTGKNTYIRGTKTYDAYNTNGTSLFVYFIADAAGSSATYIDTVAEKTSVSPAAIGGYDGHVSGGQDFGAVAFIRATATSLGGTGFASSGRDVLCDGCSVTGSSTAAANGGTRWTKYLNSSFLAATLTAISPADHGTLIQNCELSSASGTNAILSITATTDLTITDSNIHTASNMIQMFQSLAAFTSLRNTVNVVSNLYLFGANTPTITSDYNTFTFGGPTPMKLAGVDTTYAAYKAATGQDSHSTTVP